METPELLMAFNMCMYNAFASDMVFCLLFLEFEMLYLFTFAYLVTGCHFRESIHINSDGLDDTGCKIKPHDIPLATSLCYET